MGWHSLSHDVLSDPHDAEYRNDPQLLVDAASLISSLMDRPAWMADSVCDTRPAVGVVLHAVRDALPDRPAVR